MSEDYLEEIKIVRKPRSRKSDSKSIKSIVSPSLQSKTALIEQLRQKEKSEDDTHISVSDIEKFKAQIKKSHPQPSSSQSDKDEEKDVFDDILSDSALSDFAKIASEIVGEVENELLEEKPLSENVSAVEATTEEQEEKAPVVTEVVEQKLAVSETLVDSVPQVSAASEPEKSPEKSIKENVSIAKEKKEKGKRQKIKKQKIKKEKIKKIKNVPVQKVKKEKPAKIKLPKLGNSVILKYLIKELAVYFAVSFAFFFVVFFVNQILLLAETILRQRVPVLSVVKLIIYCLPAIVAQSAPFATLVGFLMCLGRIVTDNEMLVLRASGFRYSYIAIPVVVIGLAISVFGFIMNDYFLPLGVLKYNRLRRQVVQKDPAVEIEENSVKRMNGTTVVIGSVSSDSSIDDLVIFDKDKNGRDRIIVTGSTSVKKSDTEGVLMQFDMTGSTVFNFSDENKKNFDVVESQKVFLNVFDTFIQDSTNIAPREMTSFDLYKKIQELKNDPSTSHLKLNRYNLEFFKKFSMPFGSIFFAILAFPLALLFGKRDGQTLGLIFGIIISVMYWAATILGQMFGVRSGFNGFWMMWGPNILIGIVGVCLYMGLRKK